MEIVYTDFSIEDNVLYNIVKSGNGFKVITYELDTSNVIDTNIYEGDLEDCIAFITIKIIN